MQKVNYWGSEQVDPLAVKQLDQPQNSDDELIMTDPLNKPKRVKAIRQIENRFKTSKNIKVGMQKSKDQPNVTAVKVFDLLPFQQAMLNKFHSYACDDDLEAEL